MLRVGHPRTRRLRGVEGAGPLGVRRWGGEVPTQTCRGAVAVAAEPEGLRVGWRETLNSRQPALMASPVHAQGGLPPQQPSTRTGRSRSAVVGRPVHFGVVVLFWLLQVCSSRRLGMASTYYARQLGEQPRRSAPGPWRFLVSVGWRAGQYQAAAFWCNTKRMGELKAASWCEL